MIPVLWNRGDGWWTLVPLPWEVMGLDWIGPYETPERAAEKYREWMAYVVEGGRCHVCGH